MNALSANSSCSGSRGICDSSGNVVVVGNGGNDGGSVGDGISGDSSSPRRASAKVGAWLKAICL